MHFRASAVLLSFDQRYLFSMSALGTSLDQVAQALAAARRVLFNPGEGISTVVINPRVPA